MGSVYDHARQTVKARLPGVASAAVVSLVASLAFAQPAVAPSPAVPEASPSAPATPPPPGVPAAPPSATSGTPAPTGPPAPSPAATAAAPPPPITPVAPPYYVPAQQPTLPPDEPPDDGEQGILLNGVIGGGEGSLESSEPDTLFMIGFDALYFHRWFEGGIALTAGTGLFGPGSSWVSALFGPKFDVIPEVRLEVVAEGAMHTISGLGNDLFDEAIEPVSVHFPYVGGRAGASFLLGRSHRFMLGTWVMAGHDIGEKTVNVRVRSCFLGCSDSVETFTVGGVHWALLARIGGVIAQF